MTRLISSVFVAIALAGMAAPSALAESRTVSVRVAYGDLNLASPAGAKTMMDRLQSASKRACGNTGARGAMETRMARTCMKQAMTDAVKRLDAPVVTAMFMDDGRYALASR